NAAKSIGSFRKRFSNLCHTGRERELDRTVAYLAAAMGCTRLPLVTSSGTLKTLAGRCLRAQSGKAQQRGSLLRLQRLLMLGGRVYDHDRDVHKPAIADILIEDDKIVSVGPNL